MNSRGILMLSLACLLVGFGGTARADTGNCRTVYVAPGTSYPANGSSKEAVLTNNNSTKKIKIKVLRSNVRQIKEVCLRQGDDAGLSASGKTLKIKGTGGKIKVTGSDNTIEVQTTHCEVEILGNGNTLQCTMTGGSLQVDVNSHDPDRGNTVNNHNNEGPRGSTTCTSNSFNNLLINVSNSSGQSEQNPVSGEWSVLG
jgi:hypothetical protein